MNEEILKDEITNDPLTRGYSGMTDEELTVSLNTANIILPRESIPGSELFGYTDETEYLALASAQRVEWLTLCGIENIGRDAVPIVKSIFPSDTTTWENIVKTKTVSRAQELGLPKIKEGYVWEARR